MAGGSQEGVFPLGTDFPAFLPHTPHFRRGSRLVSPPGPRLQTTRPGLRGHSGNNVTWLGLLDTIRAFGPLNLAERLRRGQPHWGTIEPGVGSDARGTRSGFQGSGGATK